MIPPSATASLMQHPHPRVSPCKGSQSPLLVSSALCHPRVFILLAVPRLYPLAPASCSPVRLSMPVLTPSYVSVAVSSSSPTPTAVSQHPHPHTYVLTPRGDIVDVRAIKRLCNTSAMIISTSMFAARSSARIVHQEYHNGPASVPFLHQEKYFRY